MGLDRLAEQMTIRGLLWEALVAHQAAAVIHRRHGRQEAAAASERRAGRLAFLDDENAAHDTKPASAIEAETTAKIALLTRRELEVAQLTGEGLSNSEIATQLFISVRTVESHVWQARAKLGMSRRGDLGRLVSKLSPADRSTPSAQPNFNPAGQR